MADNDLEVNDLILTAHAVDGGGHIIIADTMDDTKANIALLNGDNQKHRYAIEQVGPGEL